MHCTLPVFSADELNVCKTALPYSATLTVFYLPTTMSNNLKLKAVPIMSFSVSSNTVVLAT